jgi:hypothetical protein
MEVTLALKGGALQVIDENLKIFGLNVSVLGRASEEIVNAALVVELGIDVGSRDA